MLINSHTHKYEPTNQISVVNISPFEKFPPIHPNIKISCGIHPWQLEKLNIPDSLAILNSYSEEKKIQVVGECGLDINCENIDKQISIFKKQIEISEEYNLPLIIHSVRTHHFILEIRKKSKAKQNWMVHGYSGSVQTANQLVKMGIFISLGPQLLSHSNKMKQILTLIPSEYLLLETDDTNIAISQIYNTVSSLMEINEKELAIIIERNFTSFFS